MKTISFVGRRCVLAAIILLGAGTGWASAQVLLPINGVTASSLNTVAGNPNWIATWASLQADTNVGGSGVLGASDSLANLGMTADEINRTGDWLTAPGSSITFDLGGTYNVSNLLIWNYNQPNFTIVGANSVTILTSTTGDAGSFSIVDNVNFAQSAGASTDPSVYSILPQNLVLPTAISDARYVELVLNSNWGFTGGLVGLNDISFVGEAVVVPEPSAYALMLGGLAVLVICIRRKSVGMQNG